jgi:hypothetical protein
VVQHDSLPKVKVEDGNGIVVYCCNVGVHRLGGSGRLEGDNRGVETDLDEPRQSLLLPPRATMVLASNSAHVDIESIMTGSTRS